MSKKPPPIDAMHPVDKILFPIMIELHVAFSQMQEKLADYIDYLKETTSAKEKIENELSIAQEILLSITPHSFPPFPNLPQVDLYATLSSLLRTIADKVKSTRNLVNILNKSSAMNNESFMFVTFFMGILDLKTGTVNYVNAGHTPPMLVRKNNGIEVSEVSKSIPLGIQEEFQYKEQTINMLNCK